MSFPGNVTVSCQTDKSGPSKSRRRRRKSSASAVAEILEKGDQEDDLQKIYDEYDDSSDDDEDIYDNIKIQKDIIDRVRFQPWRMEKKLRLISFAKSYVEKHEGQLSRGRGYKEKGARVWRHLKRLVTDTIASLTPWEFRVKAIESHFGSVVASYFLFLRWLIWINIGLTMLQVSFVIIPELVVGKVHGSINRKAVPRTEMTSSEDLSTIWDAEGVVKYSVLFYGYYGNDKTIGEGYRLPLAYLVTGFATFAVSFIVVLRKMASNSRQSRLSGKDEQFTFSWRLFCGWDFTIGNTETANLKVASNATTFRETILEEKEKEKTGNRYTLLGLRVLANIGVVVMLGGSTYAIQLCVERSRQLDIRKRRGDVETGFWEENELTLVMTIIATLFPNFFDLFAVLEKYHPRITLRWQLARIFALNLLNLYTLFIALFWKQQDMKKELEEKLINNTYTDCFGNLSSLEGNDTRLLPTLSHNSTLCDSALSGEIAKDLCWETMIGQEVFKLTMLDLIFVVGQIVIQDYIRGLFVRYCNNMCCWDMEKKFPEYADFKTAENLLHLVNNQGVIWLGVFFAPGLAVLNLLKLLVLVYIRSWSVMVCNIPQETVFRSSRSNNFYYALLLVMLFLTMLPPLFAIVALEPSPYCGPFSGQRQIMDVLTSTIEQDLPSVAGTVLEYTTSPIVIVPVFMLLGMLIYYLTVVSQSLQDANKELKHELEYERTEGKRKIYAMADAKWELKSGTESTSGRGGNSGGDGRRSGPRRTKGGLGRAAMSVLAATRVAKLLAAAQKSKVSPSNARPRQMMDDTRRDVDALSGQSSNQTGKAIQEKLSQLARRVQQQTNIRVAKTTQGTLTADAANEAQENTRVAVVRATQKFRKSMLKKESPQTEEASLAAHDIQTEVMAPITEEGRGNVGLRTFTSTDQEYHERPYEGPTDMETFNRIQRYKIGLLKRRTSTRQEKAPVPMTNIYGNIGESDNSSGTSYTRSTRRRAGPNGGGTQALDVISQRPGLYETFDSEERHISHVPSQGSVILHSERSVHSFN